MEWEHLGVSGAIYGATAWGNRNSVLARGVLAQPRGLQHAPSIGARQSVKVRRATRPACWVVPQGLQDGPRGPREGSSTDPWDDLGACRRFGPPNTLPLGLLEKSCDAPHWRPEVRGLGPLKEHLRNNIREDSKGPEDTPLSPCGTVADMKSSGRVKLRSRFGSSGCCTIFSVEGDYFRSLEPPPASGAPQKLW